MSLEEKRTQETGDISIKEALEKINVDYVSSTVCEVNKENGTLEIAFSSESSTGLVFEDESEIQAVGEIASTEAVSAKTEQTEKAEKNENKENSLKEEFSIPESFEIDEKYSTPAAENESTGIFATYVPRFTEASENYRMAGEPRTVANAVEETDEADISDEDRNPTAEYSSEVADAVNVVRERNVKLEDFGESISVYKFKDNGEGNATPIPRVGEIIEEPAQPEVEIEAEEIIKIEAEVEENGEEKKSENIFYSIPDPKPQTTAISEEKAEAVIKSEKPQNNAVSTYKGGGKITVGSEFTAFYQRDSFKDKFLDSLLSVRIRLVGILFLALTLIVFESMHAFGADVARLLHLTGARYAMSIIDLEIAMFALVLALPEVISGIKGLFKKKLSSALFVVVSFCPVIVCCCFSVATMDRTPLLVGSVTAVTAFLAVFGNYKRRTADFAAFKAVSVNREKKVMDITPTHELQKESIALDGAVDGYKSNTVRLFRTSFISDFFKSISELAENSIGNLILICISIGASLLTGVICLLVLDGAASFVSAFSTVLLLSLPAVSLLRHKLPYSQAEHLLEKDKTVIIGESSLYKISAADVVCFDDTEIFGADDVVLKGFKLYGDRDNMSKAMRQMSALFTVVGGPLEHIFASALDKLPAPATNVVIEDDGVRGSVDGRLVMAGTYEYMLRNNITVQKDDDGSKGAVDTTRIIYAAEGSEVYAKFFVRYSFTEEFTAILPQLRECGIVPLVYTSDPNVTNELLRAICAGQLEMRVMKRTDSPIKDDKAHSRISAGIVTYGDKISAISAVLLSKKYSRLQTQLYKSELVFSSVAALVGIVLSFVGITPAAPIIALLHLLGSAALSLTSKYMLSKGKK